MKLCADQVPLKHLQIAIIGLLGGAHGPAYIGPAATM